MDFKLNKSNLNFNVYTVPTVPATGAEDGIAIISSVPMKNWILSPDEPANAPRSVGDVWIRYSVTGNPFNILKQNAMLIDPFAAWQYVNGSWASVEMRRYLNGARIASWNGELYNYGDEYPGITGGWALSTVHSTPNPSDTLTKNADSMTFETHFVAGQSYAGGFLRTNNKIDLSGINSLMLTVRSVALDDATYPLALCVKSDDNAKREGVAASVALTPGGEQTFTLDVGALSGSYFIGIEADSLYGGKVEVLKFTIK